MLLPLPARLGEVRHSLPLSSAGLSPVAPVSSPETLPLLILKLREIQAQAWLPGSQGTQSFRASQRGPSCLLAADAPELAPTTWDFSQGHSVFAK